MADPTANAVENPATTVSGTGLSSLIGSLGQIGSGIIGSTAGTQSAQNFQAQGQNAINAQNAYLGQAVGYAGQGINNTQSQLGTSQGYTGQAAGALQNMYGNAQGLGQTAVQNQSNLLGQSLGIGNQSIQNQSNLLGQAQSGLQPGVSEASTAGSALNSIFANPTGTPNYSAFNNNPGYQFATQQGQNALNRQAAASGNLYSTSTMANLSQYNTGMASQNYNNYVGQLMSMAGLGNSAAATSGQLGVQTGANQGQTYGQGMTNVQNTGAQQAGTYQAAMANALGTGQGQAAAYNQGSINPLTASGQQNQAYLQQGNNAITTGQSVGDIYQNIGQMNAQGTAQNLGSLTSPTGLLSTLLGSGSGTSSGGLLGQLLGSGTGSNASSTLNNLLGQGLQGDSGLTNSSIANSLNGQDVSANLTGSTPDIGSLLGDSGVDTSGDLTADTLASGGSSDLSNLFGSFSSAGGQAAASGTEDALSGLTTAAAPDLNALASSTSDVSNAALGGIGSSVLGGALGIVGAVENPTNPAADISAVGSAASLASAAGVGAGTGFGAALGTIAAVAPYAAAIAAVGYAVYSLVKGPETKETITNPSEGTTIKLQSGNSALENDGIAFGAGTSRGQGSAQWFLDPAQSGTLDYNASTGQQNYAATNGDPSVKQGNPYFLGNQASVDLTNFANGVGADAPTTVGGKPNFSAALAAYQANPNAGTGIVGIYNNTGGQEMWGAPFSQWIQGIWQDKNGVTGNLST